MYLEYKHVIDFYIVTLHGEQRGRWFEHVLGTLPSFLHSSATLHIAKATDQENI